MPPPIAASDATQPAAGAAEAASENPLAAELALRTAELEKARAIALRASRLAALGELSAGLAHDLNNPLTIVHGYLELAKAQLRKDGGGSEEVWRFLDRIGASVDRMGTIIGKVRDFAREAPPARTPLALEAPVRNAVAFVRESLRRLGIQVVVEVAPGELVVQGDTPQLEQVFLNLLSNAREAIREAGREGGGTVTLRVRGADATVEAEVADDGVGMSEDVLRRMFEPFFTTRRPGAGAGLGVSVARDIVEEHGGVLLAESTPGEGTRVIVRLPRV